VRARLHEAVTLVWERGLARGGCSGKYSSSNGMKRVSHLHGTEGLLEALGMRVMKYCHTLGVIDKEK
jgi:hypothetical protein